MTQYEYDPEVEEVDDEPFEGDPDFSDSPTKRTDELGNQDVLEQGEALGDDLAPAGETKQEDSDA